jgi:hypothetical protein
VGLKREFESKERLVVLGGKEAKSNVMVRTSPFIGRLVYPAVLNSSA